jgi:hypothetical protein
MLQAPICRFVAELVPNDIPHECCGVVEDRRLNGGAGYDGLQRRFFFGEAGSRDGEQRRDKTQAIRKLAFSIVTIKTWTGTRTQRSEATSPRKGPIPGTRR